jgi:hypothetical protein
MSNLDDRKRAAEHKFAHDAEMEFKTIARRNKLLGLWAAEKLGKSGEDAASYAKDVVMADLETEGHDDLIGKLIQDFGRAGVAVHISEIQQKMDELLPIARKQMLEGK